MSNRHCEYHGCTEQLAQGEDEIKTGLKFCQKHADEFDKYVKANDVRKIMSFWVKATGRGAAAQEAAK
jgi:hypothetical protein